jgi:hypothetical protein
MKMELDHFFILTKPNARVGDLLLSLGLEESFSRDHEGQGTSNRRFELSNSMLELLWVRDADEANNGPGKDLLFSERVSEKDASPFGIILTSKESETLNMPFDGWSYQPDYFESPMAFHVGSNSSNILEPLCIYAPFVAPVNRRIELGKFRSVSNICISVPVESMSEALLQSAEADRLEIKYGKEHLIEVFFDGQIESQSKDLRPDLPLIVYW